MKQQHRQQQQLLLPCRIFYSTQSGRAKACARRTARIIHDFTTTAVATTMKQPQQDGHHHGHEQQEPERFPLVQLQNGHGTTFDDAMFEVISKNEMNTGSTPRRSMIEQFVQDLKQSGTQLILCFISTTGDGEHTDTIQQFWKQLLQKSLPNNLFQNISIAVFSLGDRCYGPDKYCAAGRKLIIRLRQLGATIFVNPGYGDDNTSNGGIFVDLDQWLYHTLLPHLFPLYIVQQSVKNPDEVQQYHPTYSITVVSGEEANGEYNISSDPSSVKMEEWEEERFRIAYKEFFDRQRPPNAYRYTVKQRVNDLDDDKNNNIYGHVRREITRQPRCLTNDPHDIVDDIDREDSSSMLLGHVVENRRLTAPEWEQNTRHIRLEVSTPSNKIFTNETQMDSLNHSSSNNVSNGVFQQDLQEWSLDKLPYQAGDVAAMMPSNAAQEVNAFLRALPIRLQQLADCELLIQNNNDSIDAESFFPGIGYKYWPNKCTFRGFLTYCADIHALPEREDLRALAPYCADNSNGRQQRDKLISLSETKDSALYVDYIIREKRSWVDVLYDFDSLRDDESKLTMEAVLGLLLQIRPRLFSIASSPTMDWIAREKKSSTKEAFSIELCVGVVEGTTRHGRKFHGLCSKYLCNLLPSSEIPTTHHVRLWIQPGSFQGLPLDFRSRSTIASMENMDQSFSDAPVLCIGAGTGVAPLRALIRERQVVSYLYNINATSSIKQQIPSPCPTILLFGCRKKDMDYYYADEWNALELSGHLQVLTAFSQDQWHKVYVQQVLESEKYGHVKIVEHLIDKKGAIYIAGGPKMARAVNDVVVEALCTYVNFSDEKGARKTLSKMQNLGLYSIEAWS